MNMDTLAVEMNDRSRQDRAGKMLIYLGIFSIVMLFAGLTSALVVSMSSKFWVNITMPRPFYISTIVILLSSATLYLAGRYHKAQNRTGTVLLLSITLFLGGAFAVSQWQGWTQMTQRGLFLSGAADNLAGNYGEDYTIRYNNQVLVKDGNEFYYPDDLYKEQPLWDEIAVYGNSASSYYYIITAAHLAHLAGGLLALLLTIARVALVSGSMPTFRQATIYWHFLGVLWIYLFLFLLFIH